MTIPWEAIFGHVVVPVAPTPVPVPVVDARLVRPRDRQELAAWCARFAGLHQPSHGVCPEHRTPLDYLDYVFFERGDRDPVIWSCRGGGKTLSGAVATLPDMLFKPGTEIRILGGSQEQSERMYEHLVRLVECQYLDPFIHKNRVSHQFRRGWLRFGRVPGG